MCFAHESFAHESFAHESFAHESFAHESFTHESFALKFLSYASFELRSLSRWSLAVMGAALRKDNLLLNLNGALST